MQTVVKGTTSAPFDVDVGQTVTATPGSGGSMLVEYTTDGEVAIRNNSATWQAWTAGTVSVVTTDVCMFPLYARVTAYTANGVFKLAGSGKQDTLSDSVVWKRDVVSARDAESAAAVVGAAGRLGSYSENRRESRSAVSYPIVAPAVFRNRSATIGYSARSFRAIIEFGEGECYYPDQIRVLDDTGAAVPWQWEPAVLVAENGQVGTTSIERYADGSLRCGSIWVKGSLSGGQSKRYSVEVHAHELGQSFAAEVVYSEPTPGSITQLAQATTSARFESAQNYNLRRFRDESNAGLSLLGAVGGAIGVNVKLQPSAGVGRFSHTPAHVNILSFGLIGDDNFGHGVVFRDWQVFFTWVDRPEIVTTLRYRVFDDDAVLILSVTEVTADIPSASYNLSLQAAFGDTGTGAGGSETNTQTLSATNYYVQEDTANSKFLFICKDNTRDYPVYTSEQHVLQAFLETGKLMRIGWSGTTPIKAGAFFIQSAWLVKYTGSATDEVYRRMNPVVARVEMPKSLPSRRGLRDRCIKLIDEAIDVTASNLNWAGCRALMRLSRGATASNCLSELQSWAASRGLNMASAASWLAQWQGNYGIEFTGRNAEALYPLYQAFDLAGDAANRDLVASYIHAFADFAVEAEDLSTGGDDGTGNGTVKLRSSAGSHAWNAATSCALLIAQSLSITANAGRETVLDRILAAYVAAEWFGKWNYDSGSPVNLAPSSHYYVFQTAALLKIKALRPSATIPAGRLTTYISELLQHEGVFDDWIGIAQYRRGRPNTGFFAISCLVYEGDLVSAYEVARHLQSYPSDIYTASGIDDFGVADASDSEQDAIQLASLLIDELI